MNQGGANAYPFTQKVQNLQKERIESENKEKKGMPASAMNNTSNMNSIGSGWNNNSFGSNNSSTPFSTFKPQNTFN